MLILPTKSGILNAQNREFHERERLFQKAAGLNSGGKVIENQSLFTVQTKGIIQVLQIHETYLTNMQNNEVHGVTSHDILFSNPRKPA